MPWHVRRSRSLGVTRDSCPVPATTTSPPHYLHHSHSRQSQLHLKRSTYLTPSSACLRTQISASSCRRVPHRALQQRDRISPCTSPSLTRARRLYLARCVLSSFVVQVRAAFQKPGWVGNSSLRLNILRRGQSSISILVHLQLTDTATDPVLAIKTNSRANGAERCCRRWGDLVELQDGVGSVMCFDSQQSIFLFIHMFIRVLSCLSLCRALSVYVMRCVAMHCWSRSSV
jgi:hypothetical protein